LFNRDLPPETLVDKQKVRPAPNHPLHRCIGVISVRIVAPDVLRLPGYPFYFPDFHNLKYLHYHLHPFEHESVVPTACNTVHSDASVTFAHHNCPPALRLISKTYWALPRVQEMIIWVGSEQSSNYKETLGPLILHDNLLSAVNNDRPKKFLVYLYTDRLILFKKQKNALVLHQDISTIDLLLVTYDVTLGNSFEKVSVYWKSGSSDCGAISCVSFLFDDKDFAAVWAAFLAARTLPTWRNTVHIDLQHTLDSQEPILSFVCISSESNQYYPALPVSTFWSFEATSWSAVPLDVTRFLGDSINFLGSRNTISRYLYFPNGIQLLTLVAHNPDVMTYQAWMEVKFPSSTEVASSILLPTSSDKVAIAPHKRSFC